MWYLHLCFSYCDTEDMSSVNKDISCSYSVYMLSSEHCLGFNMLIYFIKPLSASGSCTNICKN